MYLNNLAPNYLKELISIRDAKKITLRLDNDFNLLNMPAPANFSRTEGSFQFSGPNIWNDVPYEIIYA